MFHLFRRVLASAVLLSLLGAGCTKGVSQEVAELSKRTDLTIWAVIDDQDVYGPLLASYRRLHPNVNFTYRRLRLEEYEDALVQALAEDRGPDIFLVHNDWVGKYLSKIVPMPATTKIATQTIVGTVQKEMVWVASDEPTMLIRDFKSDYADVVQRDLLRMTNVGTPEKPLYQERPMGLATTVDTLALYYNKDLMNAAGIPNPPETWTQFLENVKKLTKVDSAGVIRQSGAAMGLASNVERYTDILSVLMMQNGAEMSTESGEPAYQILPASLEGIRDVPPSWQAVQFYTDFANQTKEAYTWNASMPNSLDAFIQGRTAYFLGYSYHLPQIRASAPKLNFGTSKLPQIEGNPIRNYANYWVWVVSKKSKSQDYAWNFLNYAVSAENLPTVLTATKRPSARKSLLSSQLNDEDVGVFASQVLTARSWYHGANPKAVDDAFAELINNVVNGTLPIAEAVNFSVDKIGQTNMP
ncbi:MAG: extracellular solute-binding protein [Patescibacteria group bacterium]